MIKHKLLLAGVASLAAAGLAVGGGTFAAWSDFNTEEASVGAGILQLNVSSSGVSTSEALTFGNLAPGEKKFSELYVASSDAESVPNGTLSLYRRDLVDIEDNGPGDNPPPNCTTNSEADAESPSPDGIDNDGAVDCTANGGEFAQEAVIQILRKQAVAGACNTGNYGVIPGLGVGTLASRVSAPSVVIDNDVAPGEGWCIRVELGMPNGLNDGPPGIDFGGSADSTDKSQGDRATFNVRFDLVQNVA